MRLILFFALGASLAFSQARLSEQEKTEAAERLAYVRANYTKTEYLIPMRDGVRLFTAVYTPKDKSKTYPFLISRTPYSVRPYGADNYRDRLGQGDLYVKEGFIFVYQDVRGRNKSEGEYVHVRPIIPKKSSPKDIDESTDTYDTIDWLVKNIPNNNGRAGMYGISYPGFYAAMGAIESHPALKATSPQAPVTEWFIGDDFRHNGALFLVHAFNFLSSFGRPRPPEGIESWPAFSKGTPDGYDFFLKVGPLQNFDEKYFRGTITFWKELLENDSYNEFWRTRDPRQHMKNVKPAMLTVGGWFDAEDLFGPLRLYESAEKQSPGATNQLVMGPWIHGGWARNDGSKLGDVRFGSNTSKFYQENIEFPFFMKHLKNDANAKPLPEAYMFETGRNEWHALDTWPPKQAKAKTFYFEASGKLADAKPTATGDAFDEYPSDPAKPVPFTGFTTDGMDMTYMVADQRYAASRPDVLVYQTEPLEGDLTFAGPLKATLNVSITGTDADFVVKLIDVYPGDFPENLKDEERTEAARRMETPAPRMGGYQQLVRGEPFRGKFRNGFSKPEAFTPGKVEKVEFELPDVFHTFRRGHRVMVQVQSSWFPLIDRNPQKFMRIHEARSEDFVKATHRVYRNASTPSSLTVLTLE